MNCKTIWTITTIKADPGYVIVCPVFPDNDGEPFTEAYYEPVIAWELQRFEDSTPPYSSGDWPDRIRTDIIAIGDRGGRDDFRMAGPVGIRRPDGSHYDYDDTYDTEESMLRAWSRPAAKQVAA